MDRRTRVRDANRIWRATDPRPRRGRALTLCLLMAAASGLASCKAGGMRAPGSGSAPQDEPLERPKQPMNLADAQRYVLTLVNRDRKKHGLEPVVWDEVAAKA